MHYAIVKEFRVDVNLFLVNTRPSRCHVHDRWARVLLSAILNQASNETIKDILCYRQNISGSDGVLLPPACFLTMTDVNEIEARIEFVRGLGNDVLTKSFSEKVSKVYGCL